jgi:LPXTG-motif cell wall-anchored protein
MQPEPVPQHARRRPLGVTILVVVEFLSAALITLALVAEGSLEMPLVSTDEESTLAAVAAGISLALAIGLWFLRRWAWTGVMLWHGVVLATGLLAYLRGEEPYAELAVSVLVILYLNQTDVQSAFRRRRQPAATEMPA